MQKFKDHTDGEQLSSSAGECAQPMPQQPMQNLPPIQEMQPMSYQPNACIPADQQPMPNYSYYPQASAPYPDPLPYSEVVDNKKIEYFV